MIAWRFEIKLRAEPIEKRRHRTFPDAHRAIALHVAVAARGSPAPGWPTCPRSNIRLTIS